MNAFMENLSVEVWMPILWGKKNKTLEFLTVVFFSFQNIIFIKFGEFVLENVGSNK